MRTLLADLTALNHIFHHMRRPHLVLSCASPIRQALKVSDLEATCMYHMMGPV